MQPQLLCATCNKPIPFKVPEVTGNRWHILCEACGARTALEPNPTQPEELATFSASGIHTRS